MINAKTTHTNPFQKKSASPKRPPLDAEGRRFIMINAEGHEEI